MCAYTLEFYHTIIRRPMLQFKKNIMSQISKRQEQDRIMQAINAEIHDKEEEYEREKEMDHQEKA